MLAPYIVIFDKPSKRYFDYNGKVINTEKSYVLIFNEELQSYVDFSGKPVIMEKLSELVIYDNDNECYRTLDGKEVDPATLTDAAIFDPKIK